MTIKITADKPISPDQLLRKMVIENDDHVPFTKRRDQLQGGCRSILTVTDYNGKGSRNEAWTDFSLQEIEAYDSGRVATRTITMTLDAPTRKALVEMLGGRL